MRRDLGVTEAVRETLPEWADAVFFVLSLPGDVWVVVAGLALLSLLDVGGSLRDATHPADEPLCADRTVFVVGTVFGGLALVLLLKVLVDAPRPPADLQALSESGLGFPSGHVMAATVFWGALARWPPASERELLRPSLAVALVTVVAVSRVALGAHFLVDVVASVVLGALYLVVIDRTIAGRPAWSLRVAAVLAAGAVLVSGGAPRALLALGGTLAAAVGWQLVETDQVRDFLTGRVRPLLR